VYAFLALANIVYIYGMDAAFMKYATVIEEDKKKVFSTGYLFVTITTFVFSFLLILSHSWIADEADLTNYSYLLMFVSEFCFLILQH
jgi:O-antigen/teichoic acid export membrane protein